MDLLSFDSFDFMEVCPLLSLIISWALRWLLKPWINMPPHSGPPSQPCLWRCLAERPAYRHCTQPTCCYCAVPRPYLPYLALLFAFSSPPSPHQLCLPLAA